MGNYLDSHSSIGTPEPMRNMRNMGLITLLTKQPLVASNVHSPNGNEITSFYQLRNAIDIVLCFTSFLILFHCIYIGY